MKRSRTSFANSVLLAGGLAVAAATGCGDDATPTADAGTTMDAAGTDGGGTDAGAEDAGGEDAGTDAGPVDAGMDSPVIAAYGIPPDAG